MVRWPYRLGVLWLLATGCTEREPYEPVATGTDGLVWAGVVRLTASDRMEGDQFGTATAVSGTTAVVGATNEAKPGVVYVFRRTGAVWTEVAKLTASDGRPGDYFGVRIASKGDTAAVRAWDMNSKGVVYVFDTSTFAETQRLEVGDPNGDTALDGDRLAVASSSFVDPGASVYVRSGASFVLEQSIPIARDPNAGGTVVALGGDVLVVAGIVPDVVKVFTRTGSTWTEGPSISAPNGPTQSFGAALATDGAWLVIGAPSENTTGVIYLYERAGATFVERQRITHSGANGQFGGQVSLSGNRVAVSAILEDDLRGGIYIYERSGATLVLQQHLTFPERMMNDAMSDPSLDADTLLLGAGVEDYYTGAAYVFRWGAANGEGCVLADDCASLYCVEDVCCDAACTSPCVSCLGARKASGSDGVCGVVPEGEDPRDGCATESGTSCGTTGVCDGLGACALYPADSECDPASCPTPRSEDPRDVCDGEGTCEAAEERDCEPGYLCANGACNTYCARDADCDGERGFACRDGACLIPQGEPCEEDVHCETGRCADGVCCDSACAGQCESCAEPASIGGCVVVAGEPRGDREPCPSGGDPGCGSRCDGSSRSECRFAPATEACVSSCDGDREIVGLCDGEGSCQPGDPRPCSPYVCGVSRCLGQCTVGEECVAGYRCEKGSCVPGSRCTADRRDSIGSDGVTSCGQYLCDEGTGECLGSCRSTSEDCAPGFVCNPDTGGCERAPEAAEEPVGCGCRVGLPSTSHRSGLVAAWILLAIASGARRRR